MAAQALRKHLSLVLLLVGIYLPLLLAACALVTRSWLSLSDSSSRCDISSMYINAAPAVLLSEVPPAALE